MNTLDSAKFMFGASRAARRITLILIFCPILVSCVSQAPKQVQVDANLPAEFSASGNEPLAEQWWMGFKDDELNDLIARGLQDNLSLLVIWDRLAQAEALAKQQGAALVPAINGEFSSSRSESSNDINDQTSISLGLQASYELDLWGRVRANRDAARFDVDASKEDLMAAAISLSASIANSWYQLNEQYGQIDLLSEQLQTNKQILELVTLRFRRGQANAADVLQQRQLVEARRGEIASSQSRAAVLEHQLALLLGETPDVRVAKAKSELVDLPALPETGLPAELIVQRPDIRRAYYRVLAADRRIAAAIADRFPRLSLSASTRTSATTFSGLFDAWLSTIAANLVTPLIDGGRRTAEVERSRALLSERLHDYKQVVLNSLSEVENALVQEQKQKQLIASLDKQLALSGQVISRIRDSYAKGAVDYLRVLDTLLTNQNLQRTRLIEKRRLLEFRIDLYRALAGSWELRKPELAKLDNGV